MWILIAGFAFVVLTTLLFRADSSYPAEWSDAEH